MTFDDFYRARRGFEPFPWMRRLAAHMARDEIPDVIDLPTGSGKSDIVLIWAWARGQNRMLPRRLWMVSDRRVIVDQTYTVARALEADGIVVSRLRGGIVTDDEPIIDPVAVQVITTTVDQVGSRLLFRGYGASPRSWPIWAGLAGNDSLIVLDEAHLSPVAEDTFRACVRLGANLRLASMTATPRLLDGERFGLDQEDYANNELGRRLRARRIVELRDEGTLAGAADQLLRMGCSRVAVICNTVRKARHVLDEIGHPDKHLIIGRQRPLDRDALMSELEPRLRSGADASDPFVVIATQCIEAGADFDFDGMVSEACPIDALRQRLGRLDRLGTMGESRCVLIKPLDLNDVAPYGAAPGETWKWLVKHTRRKQIDLGPEAWQAIRHSVPDEARSARPRPVTLLKPHLRMLARTSPRPRVEPDVDLLLHGTNSTPGAVVIVWRDDVHPADPDAANEILQILPPSRLEACEVPLQEVRGWLMHQPVVVDAGDVEGAVLTEKESSAADNSDANQLVLRWPGVEDGAQAVRADALHPGDVIVVPSSYGGYDKFGWSPASRETVTDLAQEAFTSRTGRRIERMTDPEAIVESAGVRLHRWVGGVIVEYLDGSPRSRIVPPEVHLSAHSKAVADLAKEYAQKLGLDEATLYRAGLHHDDGKAHRDWQLCVNGGNLAAALNGPPLAKGPFVRSVLSRLPEQWRHEAESLARLPNDTADLIRWLVATHHGYGRPFWPTAVHGIGLAEMMDRLLAKHGFWGLAHYEAVLRCADRQVSRRELDNGRA
jgi:CRISPR-associated endonuclease/helicase Cas3